MVSSLQVGGVLAQLPHDVPYAQSERIGLGLRTLLITVMWPTEWYQPPDYSRTLCKLT